MQGVWVQSIHGSSSGHCKCIQHSATFLNLTGKYYPSLTRATFIAPFPSIRTVPAIFHLAHYNATLLRRVLIYFDASTWGVAFKTAFCPDRCFIPIDWHQSLTASEHRYCVSNLKHSSLISSGLGIAVALERRVGHSQHVV